MQYVFFSDLAASSSMPIIIAASNTRARRGFTFHGFTDEFKKRTGFGSKSFKSGFSPGFGLGPPPFKVSSFNRSTTPPLETSKFDVCSLCCRWIQPNSVSTFNSLGLLFQPHNNSTQTTQNQWKSTLTRSCLLPDRMTTSLSAFLLHFDSGVGRSGAC